MWMGNGEWVLEDNVRPHGLMGSFCTVALSVVQVDMVRGTRSILFARHGL